MIGEHIQVILAVTGALTAGIFAVCFAPVKMLRLFFGETTLDAANLAVARHWGLLVGGVGVSLVYAAFHPESRTPVVALAIAEKIWIGALVLGTELRRHRLAALIATADLSMGILYILYWVGL